MNDPIIYWYTPSIMKVTRHWIFTYIEPLQLSRRKPLARYATCQNVCNQKTNLEHCLKPVLSNAYLTTCLSKVHLFVGQSRGIFQQTTQTNFFLQSIFPRPTHRNSLSYSSNSGTLLALTDACDSRVAL